MKKEINVFISWFCTFISRLHCYFRGEGRVGKKNVTGEGSLVLVIGPSPRSSTNYKVILKFYDKKRKKNKRYEWIASVFVSALSQPSQT